MMVCVWGHLDMISDDGYGMGAVLSSSGTIGAGLWTLRS